MAIRTRVFEKYVDTGVMSQVELARVLGMTPEHVSRLRHGRYQITEGFIARVCLALHAPRDLLFYDDDPGGGRGVAREGEVAAEMRAPPASPG